MAKFKLREKCDPQTYGIGLKEVWKVDPKKHQKGLVVHSIGWPICKYKTERKKKLSDFLCFSFSFFVQNQRN